MHIRLWVLAVLFFGVLTPTFADDEEPDTPAPAPAPADDDKKDDAAPGADAPTEKKARPEIHKLYVPFKDLQAIFEPGHSGGQSSGLGLHIARKLVESQRGELRVTNRHGGGAIFSFTVPAGRHVEAM